MYEWGDLRIFLAVVRSGSALGAAKTLGINQATVNRRIQALEHGLGLTLFDRKNRGHVLTEHGSAIVAVAQKVATPATDLMSLAERLRRTMAGVVRITASEEISSRIIIPIAARFRKHHPDVRIEQVVAEHKLDIVNGEADIALHQGIRPDDPGLIAKRLPEFTWTLYCSQDYADSHGMPQDIAQVTHHDFVGYIAGPNSWSAYLWFVDQAKPTRQVAHSNTIPNMRAVLKSGIGVGLLPCFSGDPEPDLIRCFPPPQELNTESWMLTSSEALNSPQVRAFVDFLVPRIVAQRDRFRGCEASVAHATSYSAPGSEN